MAKLEFCEYTPHRVGIFDNYLKWTQSRRGEQISLPLIFWSDGKPWREANMWAHECALARQITTSTIQTNMNALLAYAKWIEEVKGDWKSFPLRKSQRCLIQYRGYLIGKRDAGGLAATTVTQRMRVVIRFYRWLSEVGLIFPSNPMWNEKIVGIVLSDEIGFNRTILVKTTDLNIPNRSAQKEKLEDGLLPISVAHRNDLLQYVKENGTPELFMMLSVGFFTGMRLGTISDLKIATIENSIPDPCSAGVFRIYVGPSANPPVATKFNINGHILIPVKLRDYLLEYSGSSRRLLREARAKPENKNQLFLTKRGNTYTADAGANRSNAINVELHMLRKLASLSGISLLTGFRFHQTRSTYATELARIAMTSGEISNAISVVKEALLHKNESSSLRYIKFIERADIKSAAADSFTRDFLGLLVSGTDYGNA